MRWTVRSWQPCAGTSSPCADVFPRCHVHNRHKIPDRAEHVGHRLPLVPQHGLGHARQRHVRVCVLKAREKRRTTCLHLNVSDRNGQLS